MIKKYFSSYTGRQIDEAVRAIVENGIQLEDFSPELVAEIKQWIKDGGEAYVELEFKNHYEFPNIGEKNKLYIAIDESLSYFGKDDHYEVIKGSIPQIDTIICGGAQENGGTKN